MFPLPLPIPVGPLLDYPNSGPRVSNPARSPQHVTHPPWLLHPFHGRFFLQRVRRPATGVRPDTGGASSAPASPDPAAPGTAGSGRGGHC
jgi:hypothetical protein